MKILKAVYGFVVMFDISLIKRLLSFNGIKKGAE
jgi:hypothetical protein